MTSKLTTIKQSMSQVFTEDGVVIPVTLTILADKQDSALADFKAGDKVIVSGVSKGKGFQGVVKRYNFKGGPRTHGQKHSEREPGSIGGAGRAGARVVKGKRMPGRMGGDKITVKNLKIVKIDEKKRELLVSGAVPGKRGTVLEIRKS